MRSTIIFPLISIIGVGLLIIVALSYDRSWTFNWNGIRSQIKDSIEIAINDDISIGVIGYDARIPAQYYRRHWIMKNATENELENLTKYPNGTIRTIAYEGLLRRPNFENKSELIIRAISDTQYPIYFESGCTGNEMTIGKYLIDHILQIGQNGPPNPNRNTYGLSEKELEGILMEFNQAPTL